LDFGEVEVVLFEGTGGLGEVTVEGTDFVGEIGVNVPANGGYGVIGRAVRFLGHYVFVTINNRRTRIHRTTQTEQSLSGLRRSGCEG